MGRLFNPQGPLGIFESIIETDGRGPQHAYEAILRIFPREPYAYYPCAWTDGECTDGCHAPHEAEESEDSEGSDESEECEEPEVTDGEVSKDGDIHEHFEVNTQDYLADV